MDRIRVQIKASELNPLLSAAKEALNSKELALTAEERQALWSFWEKLEVYQFRRSLRF